MGVLNPNSTSYVHPDEPNLLNIHKAMTYDPVNGEPHLRVTLGSDTITITGDVNLLDTVSLTSSTLAALENINVQNTVSVTVSNFPTTSTVYQGTDPWRTTVTNWPALQYVNGTLYAVQSGTWSVGVTGNVTVDNFTSTVNIASMPAVSGTVSVSNFTSTVYVSNFTSTVHVDNFPTSVTVTNFTSTVNINTMPAVSGTVAISSLPAVTGTVTVNGSVTVTNFTSTVNVASLPAITGTVVVSNFTSTVHVDNFPTSVTVTNFTSTVFVSNTVTISNTSFAVTNFPTTSTVYQGTSPWITSGTVAVTGITTVDFPPSSTTAFGELMAITMTPVIQADMIHGLDPDQFSVTEINSGTVTVTANSTWEVASGTQANGYARLKTNRFLRYQPGQGAIGRWTAAFTAVTGSINTGTKYVYGVDNIYQLAGFYGREDGYAFGYSGDPAHPEIGVLHRYGGKVEIRTLTINTAPTGNQNITVTLNGVPYTVAVVAGTTGETAGRIAVGLKAISDAHNRWDIQYCASTVTFCYYTTGNKNGTYSLSSSGAGTLATGTFSRSQIGATPNDVWTYVRDWNGTVVNFDPTKLNLYSVDFRWLGAGRVRFMMEDPATGEMVVVHTQVWGSSSLIPHMIKPNLRISYRSGSTSGAAASQNVIVTGASCMAGVEGIINQTGHSEGWYNIDSTNKAKDTVWHLISVQNPYIRTNGINTSQLIIQDLTVAAQGADPAVIYVVVNPTGVSSPLVFAPIPGPATTRVFAQASVSAVSENLAVDNIANVQTLAINGSATFDLKPYNFSLAPGDMISVFASSSNALTRTTVGLSWRVD